MSHEAYSNALAVLFVLGVCSLTFLVCLSPVICLMVRTYKRQRTEYEAMQQRFDQRREKVEREIDSSRYRCRSWGGTSLAAEDAVERNRKGRAEP